MYAPVKSRPSPSLFINSRVSGARLEKGRKRRSRQVGFQSWRREPNRSCYSKDAFEKSLITLSPAAIAVDPPLWSNYLIGRFSGFKRLNE